jgi:succinoglycan biosynthesis protein ExoA
MNSVPSVTVIMPIRNEAAYIARSLGSILAQDYPADRLQILIVDGMSTDATRELVQRGIDNLCEAGNAPTPALLLLDNPKRIVAAALNVGLAHTHGEIIVRVDGHTEIEPDYVRTCVETLLRTGADNVGGRMDPVSKSRFGQAVALATSTPFGVGGARFHYSQREEWVDTVYLGAWRRDVFARIGHFDEELVRNQDDEFNYRLRKHGGKILLNPAIRSHYTNRSSLQSLWRQYYQYGYWKVRVLQKHPAQMQWRQFVPPLFVAALVGGALLAPFSNVLAILWSTLLVLYLLANLAASVWTAAQQGWRHLLLLPVVFAILHISYGLGFLVGLIRFAHRWRAAAQSVVPVQSS